MLDILHWVSLYLKLGWRPIPIFHPDAGCQCKAGCADSQCHGKVPIDANWAEKIYTIKDFYRKCNVGLAMGRQQNCKWLFAVDNDDNAFHSFIADLPLTLESETGRGYHQIYEVPPDTPLGNWVDVLGIRPKNNAFQHTYYGGVDLRYARGIVVAAPSVHKNGRIYTWRFFKNPVRLPYHKLVELIRIHKRRFPKVKTYKKWSQDPTHKNKRP